jgi:hypothetical protein
MQSVPATSALLTAADLGSNTLGRDRRAGVVGRRDGGFVRR